MNTRPDDRRTESYRPRIGVLDDELRREIVRILRGRSDAVSEADLAERLAATASDPDAEAASVRIRLHHVHLPKLADSGLVDRNEAERTVAATDHPMYDADRPVEPNPDSVESSTVVDGGRREVLAVVESRESPLSREELARELASRETAGIPTETLVEDITLRLHHSHLPKLDDAGLVEYDPDTGTVSRRGAPEPAPIAPGDASDT